MFRTAKIFFVRFANSLIRGYANAKTNHFFNLTVIALIYVLSLQLTACGSTAPTQASGRTPTTQIASPTPTNEATQLANPTTGASSAQTPTATPKDASQGSNPIPPAPTPTSKPRPTPAPKPTPALIPADPTQFTVNQDGGELHFPDVDHGFDAQPIQLINNNDPHSVPISWVAGASPNKGSEGQWLSLDRYHDAVNGGVTEPVQVQVSIANLCSRPEQYTGTVTFTSPSNPAWGTHSVTITVDLSSNSSVPPCSTNAPPPSPTPASQIQVMAYTRLEERLS